MAFGALGTTHRAAPDIIVLIEIKKTLEAEPVNLLSHSLRGLSTIVFSYLLKSFPYYRIETTLYSNFVCMSNYDILLTYSLRML